MNHWCLATETEWPSNQIEREFLQNQLLLYYNHIQPLKFPLIRVLFNLSCIGFTGQVHNMKIFISVQLNGDGDSMMNLARTYFDDLSTMRL